MTVPALVRHESGNVSGPQCAAAGAHYDLGGHTHGSANGPHRHAGDLGNVRADTTGAALVDVTVDLPLSAALGRSVVVHAQRDDLGGGSTAGSKANGSSGVRVACAHID